MIRKVETQLAYELQTLNLLTLTKWEKQKHRTLTLVIELLKL